MAGSISLSLTQRYDKTSHLPLDGGQLTFYEAGTTTPQNAYQDISLTIPWPNPITMDSGGNIPQLFFADGYIKFRLSNSVGVVQLAADYVLVMGPTAGAGAAPSVDATTILQPGAIVPYYGTGVRTGFVRANGRTIGSATSGATEYANVAAEDLFIVLYEDPNLTVSTGRGASAAADWAANKTIAVPDLRGRVIAGPDSMGNSAAGLLTAGFWGASVDVLGAASGAETQTLALSQLPAGITSSNLAAIPLQVTSNVNNVLRGPISVPTTGGGIGATTSGVVDSEGTIPIGGADVTSNNTGAAAHPNMQPTMLITQYIKL